MRIREMLRLLGAVVFMAGAMYSVLQIKGTFSTEMFLWYIGVSMLLAFVAFPLMPDRFQYPMSRKCSVMVFLLLIATAGAMSYAGLEWRYVYYFGGAAWFLFTK